MAVFTPLDPEEARRLVRACSLGHLDSLEEIGQGIENSNYFLVVVDPNGCRRKYVITIFEMFGFDEVPFFLSLMDTLARAGLPVPAPGTDDQGEMIQDYRGKPLVVFPCLPGDWLAAPSVDHCRQLGGMMANLHSTLANVSLYRDPERPLSWMKASAGRLNAADDFPASSLLDEVIRELDQHWPALDDCRQGVVHGDLFRDNILFHQGKISGVIDFYHACTDFLLYDVAVAVNDWAFDEREGKYLEAHEHGIVSAYQDQTPWTEAEKKNWRVFLLRAAASFWISRLISRYLPGYQKRAAQGDVTKDPAPFQRRVEVALSRLRQISH